MPNNDYYDDFRLAQRMEPDPRNTQSLRCEYMGRAEFEFGVLPKARARLISSSSLIVVSQPITFKGITREVFFLADESTIDEKIRKFKGWLTAGLRSKEATQFDWHFISLNWRGDPLRIDLFRTKVWWVIDADFAWSLDRQWLEVFRDLPELRATPLGLL